MIRIIHVNYFQVILFLLEAESLQFLAFHVVAKLAQLFCLAMVILTLFIQILTNELLLKCVNH